ncbi:MAG TPA: hypothetical protein VK592_02820 [Candidatus Dormibacteraeota bacterium]|jgi:hypothetical protein|nr:hypothetical protein [Candidatus Dormibacteraeota bacterium]
MIRLELSEAEAATLRDVLESYVSDLRMEIAGTEEMGLREALKAREAVLNGLVERLSAGLTRRP